MQLSYLCLLSIRVSMLNLICDRLIASTQIRANPVAGANGGQSNFRLEAAACGGRLLRKAETCAIARFISLGGTCVLFTGCEHDYDVRLGASVAAITVLSFTSTSQIYVMHA